jgi:predicted nucleic acid-binding protein
MRILLDTNIFIEDYLLRGANFRLFFSGLPSLPASLRIPEVVIDEVANHYREELIEATGTLQHQRASLDRLLPSDSKLALPQIAIDEHVTRMRANLERMVRTYGEILPYPDLPHKRVVERDLARKKPFKRDGSGYRDYLIWENVKSQIIWGTERVVFVTNNPKDFGEGPLVDPELRQEIKNLEHLKLIRSLREFNETFIIPRLKMLEDVKVKLQSAQSKEQLISWLQRNLLDILRNTDDLGTLVAGFPPRVGSVWPTEIAAYHKFEVGDVRELDLGEKLVPLTVSAEVELSIDINWEDYVNQREVQDWFGEGSEKFDSAFTQHVTYLDIDLELTVRLDPWEVTAYELLGLSGGYGSSQFK